MQVRLRELRSHAILHAAGPTTERRSVVVSDEQGFASAFANFRKDAVLEEDAALVDKIAARYENYQSELLSIRKLFQPIALQGSALLAWADAHSVKDLMNDCRELAGHQRERMRRSLEQSEVQNRWAGRVLLAIGLVGVLGGLLSGYAAARRYSSAPVNPLVRAEFKHTATSISTRKWVR